MNDGSEAEQQWERKKTKQVDDKSDGMQEKSVQLSPPCMAHKYKLVFA